MTFSNILKSTVKISTIIIIGLAIVSCSTKVERTQAKDQKELSGKWNANDSKLVSKKAISSMLAGRWLRNHLKKNQKAPTIIVGKFTNLSHEIINIKTFIADIEREMINSGEIEFVASSDERNQIRDERLNQQTYSTSKTRKKMFQELGADYMLIGNLNSFVERVEGVQNIQYQIDMTLISLKNNKKVWVESQKHAKTIKRTLFGL